jgi:hypothetical protein
MTTLVKRSSPRAGENRVFQNAFFMEEAEYLLRLSRLYAPAANAAPARG